MGSNPVNLAARFVLELVALVALGRWGLLHNAGLLRFVLAAGIPMLAALLWGLFAVPNDPSRSGKAIVPVPGIVRLLLEIAFFTLAAAALSTTGATALGWTFAIAVAFHYPISYDRVFWLLRQR